MKQVMLKNVKKGDFFILTENPKLNEDGEVMSKYVYVRDTYERSEKKYYIYKFDDTNNIRTIKGERKVWIDFFF